MLSSFTEHAGDSSGECLGDSRETRSRLSQAIKSAYRHKIRSPDSGIETFLEQLKFTKVAKVTLVSSGATLGSF